MARGWESKSVEEQQSEFGKSTTEQKKPSATPASRERDTAAQALHLQRARVVAQIGSSQNARFIELMQKELAFLDAELAKLEG